MQSYTEEPATQREKETLDSLLSKVDTLILSDMAYYYDSYWDLIRE